MNDNYGFKVFREPLGDYAYIPGVIGNSKVNLITISDIFSYNDLIHNMIVDFEALGI